MGLALAAPLHAQTLTVADRATSSTLSRDTLLAPPEAHDPQSLSDGDIDAIVAWLTYKAPTPP